MGTEDQAAVREQAIKLTRSTFRRMSPAPLRPVEKVAPIVYALLIDDVDPDVISQALINARAHTADGISYALRQIMPAVDKTAKPRYHEVRPSMEKWDPSDEEKEAARTAIAEARARLRGEV